MAKARVDLLKAWEEDTRIRGITAHTIYNYRWCLKDFSTFLDGKSILKADKLDLREYVDASRKKGLTKATVGIRLKALSSFYQWAQFEDLRVDNPIPEIKKRYLHSFKGDNSESHTHKCISIQEAARLVDTAVDIRDKAIILLLLKTGIRRGELLRIEVSDIDWHQQSITLKPTAKRSNRIVFFDDETARVLRRWLAVREYRNRDNVSALWITSFGRALGYQVVLDMIYKVATKANVHDPASKDMEDHFSAHCCRHWFTTHLLRAGMERPYVQWLRGDAIKEAVDIYYHIAPEDVRKSYLSHIPQLGV